MKDKEKYVPFVSEVEEFNTTMGKPNNYEPTIPTKQGILLKFLMLYVTLPMFHWVTELCYMALRIKYGQRTKKYKHQICQKLALAKKRHKRPLGYVPKSKRKRVTMKRLETIILSIEHVTKKL